MKVIYFQIKDAQAKLRRIVWAATEHFKKKEPFLILAPNRAAVEFLDLLLWRHPEESFLPHHAGSETTVELITITDEPFNSNQAMAIFNLRAEPVDPALSCQLIYELEDLTSPEAQKAFKMKFTNYQAQSFSILSE